MRRLCLMKLNVPGHQIKQIHSQLLFFQELHLKLFLSPAQTAPQTTDNIPGISTHSEVDYRHAGNRQSPEPRKLGKEKSTVWPLDLNVNLLDTNIPQDEAAKMLLSRGFSEVARIAPGSVPQYRNCALSKLSSVFQSQKSKLCFRIAANQTDTLN